MVSLSLPIDNGAAGEDHGRDVGVPGPLSDDNPIVITSDPDLVNLASTMGLEGNGSVLEPYMIKDLDINGSGNSACMLIEGVSLHLVITNCSLYHADQTTSTDWINGGLVIVGTSNVTVTENVIDGNMKHGISIIDSNVTILDNDISNNDVGVYARRTSANVVENVFTRNNQSVYSRDSYVEVIGNSIDDLVGDKISSIDLENSDLSKVRGNSITNAKYGIQLRRSSSTVIESNRITNSTTGLWILSGMNTIVKDNIFNTTNGVSLGDLYGNFYNNTFHGGGIDISGGADALLRYTTHVIDINNTFEGAPILYLKNQTDVTIDSTYGQIIVANCSGVTFRDTVQTDCFQILFAYSSGLIMDNNVIVTDNIRCDRTPNMDISGNEITSARISIGSDDAVIDGNTLTDCFLSLRGSHRFRVSNNTMLNRGSTVISIGPSSMIEFLNNSITVEEPTFASPAILINGASNLILRNNRMNGSGIHMWTDYSTWKTHEIDTTNTLNGLPVMFLKEASDFHLSGDFGQIILAECRDFSLSNLTMKTTSPQIQMALCQNGTITGCDLRNNIVRYSIEARLCQDLTISNNNLDGNRSCIYLYDCDRVIINRNRIVNSSTEAINLGEASECSVSENDIINSRSYGLYMYGSDNVVTLNNFIDNNRDPDTGEVIAPQCRDAGYGNIWSQNGKGNYWSDYEDKYPNASYSGDVWVTPYELDGGRAVDEYPLVHMHDYVSPTISPIEDITVDQGHDVTLHVEAWDDRGIVKVEWTIDQPGGPIVLEGWTVNVTFPTPGTFRVVVTVADAVSNIASTTFNVIVIDTMPPVANAGEDIYVDMGSTLTFNGTGSEDNVAVVAWEWSFDYDGMTVLLEGSTPKFLFEVPGEYLVNLQISDARNLSANDTLTVHVNDNVSPLAIAPDDITVGQHTMVVLRDDNSTDVGSGILSWEWTFQYGTREWTMAGREMEFMFDDVGSYDITLTIKDGFGNTDSAMFMVRVLDTTAPIARTGDDLSLVVGTQMDLSARESTDNVGILSYTWTLPDDRVETREGPDLTMYFGLPGNHLIELVVTDTSGNTGSALLWVNVTARQVGLEITSPPNNSQVGSTFVLLGNITSDIPTVILRYRTSNAEGVVQKWRELAVSDIFSIPVNLTGLPVGVYTIELTVDDGYSAFGPVDWNLEHVVADPEPEEDDEEPWIYWLLLVAAVVAVAAVTTYIVRRR